MFILTAGFKRYNSIFHSPELTWRDMQHLIVRTASRVSNDRENQWTRNGAGHWFHPKLGFGVLGKFQSRYFTNPWIIFEENTPGDVYSYLSSWAISMKLDSRINECIFMIINYAHFVSDATKMVDVARNWTTVPPQRKCMALKVNHTK